jgi:hypothetical protein
MHQKISYSDFYPNGDKKNENLFEKGKPRIMSVLLTAPSKMWVSGFERETSPTEEKPYMQAARLCTSEYGFLA